MIGARNVAELHILGWSVIFLFTLPVLRMNALIILRSFFSGIFATQFLFSYCYILLGLVAFENGEDFLMRRRFGQRVAVWLRKFEHMQGAGFRILFPLVLLALCYSPLFTLKFDQSPFKLLLGPGVLLFLCYITMMLIVKSKLE